MAGCENKKEYKVGKLAALANVGLGTVRHYQKLGLLPIPSRPVDGGARKYSQAELHRLLLIKNAQTLGFSLDEPASIACCLKRARENAHAVRGSITV